MNPKLEGVSVIFGRSVIWRLCSSVGLRLQREAPVVNKPSRIPGIGDCSKFGGSSAEPVNRTHTPPYFVSAPRETITAHSLPSPDVGMRGACGHPRPAGSEAPGRLPAVTPAQPGVSQVSN